MSDRSVAPMESPAIKIPQHSSASSTTNVSSSMSDISSSSASKTRVRKAANADHQLNALKELMEVWNTKSKEENHSAEDRYQLLELRDKILRLSKCFVEYVYCGHWRDNNYIG
jgi:hypothetical protein